MTNSIPPPHGYTLEDIYEDAISQLRAFKDAGHLSPAEYELLLKTKKPEDILDTLQEAIEKNVTLHADTKRRARSVLEPLLLRLERFSSAIDILAQSSLQAMGLNFVGLIWGSVRFLLVVARDIIDTFNLVLETLEDIVRSLPSWEAYVQLYRYSRIQLLRPALVQIYSDLINFGLCAIRLFNRSTLGTLGRSAWKSLKLDFGTLITSIEKHSKTVDREAQVEHLSETSHFKDEQAKENQKADTFRREIRLFFAQLATVGGNPGHQLPLRCNDAPIDLLSTSYIDRQTELRQIQDCLNVVYADGPSRCVIYGMPGVGKTQLALKYTITSFREHHYSYIFWASAATPEKLSQGLVKILDLLKLPDRFNPDQSARLMAARSWLESGSSESEKRWLLVLDNANRGTLEDMRRLLPRMNSAGHILFTTRTEDVAEALASAAGRRHSCMELQTPALPDAVRMLLHSAGFDEDSSYFAKAQAVVNSVGRLPVAIDQAASFMKQTHKNLDDLLNIYTGEHKSEVLRWENNLSSYEKNSVEATFASSFVQLDTEFAVIANLLRILAFLDPESISIDVIVNGSQHLLLSPSVIPRSPDVKEATPKWRPLGIMQKIRKRTNFGKSEGVANTIAASDVSYDSSEVRDLVALIQSPVELQKAIQTLQTLSLVRRQGREGTSALWIHDLVQYLIRTNLMEDAQQKVWFKRATLLICGASRQIESFGSPRCWPQCEILIPHIQLIARQRKIFQNHDPVILEIISSLALYFWSRGLYLESKELFTEVLAEEMRAGSMGGEKAQGLEHMSPLHTTHNLGILYMDQGKLAEAEAMHQRALAGYEKALGAEHRWTLRTVHNLGNLRRDQGRLAEAGAMYQWALAGYQKTLGPEHMSTLDAFHSLGLLYKDQGKLAKAEAMCQQTLVGREKALGPEHKLTLDTVHNLGLLRREQGKLAEAEAMYQSALAGYEKALGPEHMSTLNTVNNLGVLYADQGKITEAETMYQRALAGYEKVLGPEHKSKLNAVHSLGLLRMEQGELAEAETMYQSALAGYEKALGPEHMSTLNTAHNLGVLRMEQGKLAEAEVMYQRALAGYEKALSPGHGLTLNTINNLGILYADQGKVAEAEVMYVRALQGYEMVPGPEHTSTLNTVNNLGVLYANQGKMAEAEVMYVRALQGYENAVGTDHPRTRKIASNLNGLRTSS